MSDKVSIMDVARAAGVSKTTVSRVINEKLDKFRIGIDTQKRVRDMARQMGYQPDPAARDVALGKFHPVKSLDGISNEKSQIAEAKKQRQIGIIISTDTTITTLGLIPGIEAVLEAEDYLVVIVIVSPEPTAVRERVTRLLQDGVAGILGCPSVYPVVSAMTAGKCQTIVLWQGAGKAMLAKEVGSAEYGAPEAEVRRPGANERGPIGTSTTNNASTQQPQAQPAPAMPPQPTPVTPVATPKPVVIVMPIPIVPKPIPAVEPVARPEPAISVEPAPEPPLTISESETVSHEVTPPIIETATPDPVAESLPVETTVTTPEPEITSETPPPETDSRPETTTS
ncbi:MAG: LacI family DNA-binding transcriptional regulator [bacterium]